MRTTWKTRALGLCVAGFCLSAQLHDAALAEPTPAEPTPAEPAKVEATFSGSERTFSFITGQLSKASPLSIKPVGTTSLVFKIALKGDLDAAFKPETRTHAEGHRAEVWAYTIARALGLTNVVPAVVRSFGVDELKSLLRGRYKDRWPSYESELVAQKGRVSGAMLYWVPGLRELGLDGEAGVTRWSRWLAQDEALPDAATSALASQVSSMVCFDYLIGNWDRFSGANAQGDTEKSIVYLRDHNVAFAEPLSKSQQARLLLRLRRVQRFSREFVTQLKTFQRERAEREVQAALPPLRDAQWAAIEQRRLTLLSYISALIDKHGEERVLPFP